MRLKKERNNNNNDENKSSHMALRTKYKIHLNDLLKNYNSININGNKIEIRILISNICSNIPNSVIENEVKQLNIHLK